MMVTENPQGSKGIGSMMNGFEELQKTSKESMNKAMESYGTMSKGLQAIAVESADFSKKSFEEGAAHLESLMAAKSLDVAIEAQTDFLKSAYEDAVSQATKIGELYTDLAKDAMKPFEGFMPKTGK
jgi:phasin family protein